MNEKLEDIKKIVEFTEGLIYVEVEEFSNWELSDDESEMWYGLLEDGEWEYSCEVNAVLRKDGLVFINVDTGCGDTITMVLDAENEVMDD